MSQVEQRIEEAIQQNRTNLDLSSLGLTSLPDSFLRVAPQLEVLTLAKNGFINLPKALGACRNLQVLILDKNKLSELYGIRSLQKLNNLSLNENELTYFPTDLLELKSLEILWMNENAMTSIPQGILELKKLQSLSVTNNSIETLPVEIAQLSELANIHLSGNPLKTPPIEIALRGIHSIRGYFEDLSKTKKQKTENYLLTIAIDEYSDTSFSNQIGRVEDAQSLAKVLDNKYDYRSVELYNETATGKNILEQLNSLVAETKENDSVIIYFNSQISDAFGYGYFSYNMKKIEEKELYSAISKMRAQHVLVIIDFHYYTDRGTASRSISLEKGTYSSRWIMHRQGSEWEDRFTPQLVEFLENLNFEIGVQELLSILKDVVIAPLNLGGDEGGMFNFIPRTKTSEDKIKNSFSQEDLKNLKQEYKNLIGKAKIKELLKLLITDFAETSSLKKEIVSIKEDFDKTNLEFGLSSISYDDRNIKLNNLNIKLLEIIDSVKVKDLKKNEIVVDNLSEHVEKVKPNFTNLDKRKKVYKEYVAKAETRKLFEIILNDLSKKSSSHQDFSLLKNRFDTIRRDQLMGISSDEENNIAFNKVNYAILNIIDDLGDKDFEKDHIEMPNAGAVDFTDEQKETLEKINENIVYVEELRKNYFEINSIKEKNDILKSIDNTLAEIESLREQSGANHATDADEEESFKFLEEEKLWQNALAKNTKEDYQKYLEETLEGTYRQEATVALRSLELEGEEDILFEKIKNQKDISLINIYRSEFSNGKYIQEVETIFGQLEQEEDELWERLSDKNTIQSYDEYLDKSKLKTYQRNAVDNKKRLDGEGTESRINEAKLIFVGNGRVGKTSLTKRLVSNDFDPKEESTHGIRIEKWPLKLEDGRTVQVNIWDFGGQEIYHNTHRFFLTNRALYILVWDMDSQIDAEENPEKEENFIFDYWLENVSGLSEESPVLVVQNKMEEPATRGFDLTNLTEKKGWNVKETLSVSAAKGWNIDELRNSISKQLQNAPKLKNLIGYDLGEGWSAVRKELETLALEQPYLKFDDYLRTCDSHEISTENAGDLSRFLTDIGVIIHFPDNDILKEMVILDPRWTTKIIYRLLNEKIKEKKGEFKKSELKVNMKNSELEKFSKEFRFRDEREIQIFLELMTKFEICFELPNERDSFIVPQFLSEEIQAFDWESKKAIKYGYQYDFLHKGIIARAIVKLNKYALDNTWWRNGLLIEKKGIKAKIEALPKQNEIRIEIIGEGGEQLRDFLLNDVFEEVNHKMDFKTIRYCPSETCDCIFEEEVILKLDKENEKSIYCSM
ncbi:MAG: COR domain-containing protein [Saprospiraceae bacterium]